ncbi:nucleoid-associated protein YejK [Neptunicella marina]|uniref:Nucleoid-associated protein YejK n=1 Tax=Neptunicella marina TaxID=2125989 RepID=A0A8J6IL23_9ALTE|nr:nucleoid-associated protein YejK [Neptunicella marina]MBC3764605.1 nucleoid-associated protein YejK [Neptunicella marina]
MSAIIHHFVVHQLAINEAQELTLVPRENCYPVSAQIEGLAAQLNQVFAGKPGKGVGGLIDADEDNFTGVLQQLGEDEQSFYDFSVATANILKNTLVEFGRADTGFLIFCQYQFLATDYIFIGLLNTKQHVEINHNLELNYSTHLDLAKMQLAARIDLTERRINPDANRYVSFIKGLAGRKVSDFFLAFLGCEELVDIKQQNKQLVAVVDDYFQSEQLDPHEKQQGRQQMVGYYKEKIDAGEDITIEELADHLPKGNASFVDFARNTEQPMEEKFQADPAVIKSLSKFSGGGAGLTISFERKLLGERVQYDPHSDTLLIKGVPPNLKDQLLKSGN